MNALLFSFQYFLNSEIFIMHTPRITFNKSVSEKKNLKFHISVFSFHIGRLKISKFDKMESQVFHHEKKTENVYLKHFLF